MATELSEDTQQLRAIVENVLDGIIIFDDAFTYVDINPAACDLLRLEKKEIVGRQIGSLGLIDKDFRRTWQACREADWSAQEITITHGNNINRQLEWFARAAFLPNLNMVLLRDITERKLMEQRLRQSQKMEAIGRLAGGVAHDFNNMLTAIRGYAELLLQKLGPDDPLRRYGTGILCAADRSALITQQLLAFSRRQVLQPQLLNLNSTVEEIGKLLRGVIGEDIELKFFLADDLGLAKADPGQIGQIILNLALNARDAMPSGGRLFIETANMELDEAYCKTHIGTFPGSYVMLSVTDTGFGMSPELQSHIFEPFFTTKAQGKGTGLGLATVYGIVKQSGGSIWLYSEVGEGTTFKIYLPQMSAEPASESVEEGKAELNDRTCGQKTILLVEDEDTSREMVCECLQNAGYRVLSAMGGDEALTLCERHQGAIHLMLADLVMPGTSAQDISGYLTLRHPDAKVLYMSGFSDDMCVARGTLEPGAHFLQKPFRLQDLLSRIRELICAEQYG